MSDLNGRRAAFWARDLDWVNGSWQAWRDALYKQRGGTKAITVPIEPAVIGVGSVGEEQPQYMDAVNLMPVDADEVWPGLWQGSRPPPGTQLAREGFGKLVLAAMEFQPQAEKFPGVDVVHCPFDDAYELPDWVFERVVQTAKEVARDVRDGVRVLVTCNMGINRSGLINGLAMMMLSGEPAMVVASRIQMARPGALRNSSFVELMRKYRVQGAVESLRR